MDNNQKDITSLKTCFGKFTYVRGSSHAIHFMPLNLKLFQNSINFSQLFFLRSLRTKKLIAVNNSLKNNEEMNRYMGKTSVKPVAERVIEFLNNIRDKTPSPQIIEFNSGLGIIFEYIKLLYEQTRENKKFDSKVSFGFYPVGHSSERLTFEVLHGNEREMYNFSYIDNYNDNAEQSNVFDLLKDFDVCIYNHERQIRQNFDPSITIDDFIQNVSNHAVIAARVTTSEMDEVKTTVTGKEVLLPSLKKLLVYFQSHSSQWQYSFEENFERDFFLPPHRCSTGLLIAHTTN